MGVLLRVWHPVPDRRRGVVDRPARRTDTATAARPVDDRRAHSSRSPVDRPRRRQGRDPQSRVGPSLPYRVRSPARRDRVEALEAAAAGHRSSVRRWCPDTRRRRRDAPASRPSAAVGAIRCSSGVHRRRRLYRSRDGGGLRAEGRPGRGRHRSAGGHDHPRLRHGRADLTGDAGRRCRGAVQRARRRVRAGQDRHRGRHDQRRPRRARHGRRSKLGHGRGGRYRAWREGCDFGRPAPAGES